MHLTYKLEERGPVDTADTHAQHMAHHHQKYGEALEHVEIVEAGLHGLFIEPEYPHAEPLAVFLHKLGQGLRGDLDFTVT